METIHLTLNENDKLKPCPFCGGEDLELQNTHTASYWIECLSCGCELHGEAFSPDDDFQAHHAAKDSAIEAWQRRV